MLLCGWHPPTKNRGELHPHPKSPPLILSPTTDAAISRGCAHLSDLHFRKFVNPLRKNQMQKQRRHHAPPLHPIPKCYRSEMQSLRRDAPLDSNQSPPSLAWLDNLHQKQPRNPRKIASSWNRKWCDDSWRTRGKLTWDLSPIENPADSPLRIWACSAMGRWIERWFERIEGIERNPRERMRKTKWPARDPMFWIKFLAGCIR